MKFEEVQEVEIKNSLIRSLNKNDCSEKIFAIYGIGAVAKKLIDDLDTVKIAGLMDKDPDNIGKRIYGLNVLSNDYVIKKVDAIIIAANEVYWDTIFKRIAFLKYKYGKEIFFLNGKKAELRKENKDVINNPYWNKNIDMLKDMIDEYEVISFDIFDTLITRKVARPEDIFNIVEMKLRELIKIEINFSNMRREAEEICRKISNENFNLHEIYNQLKAISCLPDTIINQLKQLEIETELEYSAPRKDIVECFYYALKKNKAVYVISDIYLTKDIITDILKKNGIEGYINLLISCDMNKSKATGTMWQYFSNLMHKKKCLHIGDNEISDVINAETYGIDTFKIMSGYDMLLNSTVKDIIINVCNTNDSIAIGVIINQIFNSPFALNKSKGSLEIDDLYNFGYVFFGPIILNYFIWLIKEIKKDKVDKVLFLAREGYVLEKLYSKIINILDLKNVPQGIYFKTSRRMASVPAIKSKKDIYMNLENSFSGSLKELLYYRFGIISDIRDSCVMLTNFDSNIKRLIEPYESKIIENASNERKAYLKYIEKLDLNNKKIALVDTGIKGTIQYYLSRIVDTELIGYYFTAYTGHANPYGLGNSVKALYPETQLNNSTSNILKNHILFESTLVAPEGMYISVDLNGDFTNGPQLSNQILFNKKSLIHEGIEAFIREMLDLNKKLPEKLLNEIMVDKLYGLPLSDQCHIKSNIRELFFVDEMFGAISEKKIWD